jgi:ribosomal-protein-alanine N-acetyltransferase
MRELRSGTELEVLTSRMLVRLTQQADAEALLKILRDHRVSSRFLEPVDADDRVAQASLMRDFTMRENEPDLHFTALRREESTVENTIIGAAGLCNGEISYCVDPEFWHQGYGYELAQAVCGIARDRLGAERLLAKVLRDNLISRRILERLGFLFCGLEYLPHAYRAGKYAVLNFALNLRS